MVVMEVASLIEGVWSCYRSGHLNEGSMVILHTEVITSIEGEWSCYRKFNGWRMVILRRWAVLRRENGHVTEWSV